MATDLKEAERALQWAIRAARNGIQITEQERMEAQAGLMSLLNLLDATPAPISRISGDAGTEVQFQRRSGTRNGVGGFKWYDWRVCTWQEAQRVDGLRSWQWRKVTATAAAAGVPCTMPEGEKSLPDPPGFFDDDWAPNPNDDHGAPAKGHRGQDCEGKTE